MNICNAFTKYDELELFIQRVNTHNPVSVLCLNECWLNEKSTVSTLHLPDYNMFYQIGRCPGHSPCGLITYVHNSFRSEEVVINRIATGWEHLTIQISHRSDNSKTYTISNVYRPLELDLFKGEFSDYIESLCNLKKSCYICGDFNINLIDINSNQHVNEYFELICSKGFFPSITLPTRIQPPAISLIDNILANNINEAANSMSELLINDLSDHKLIFTLHKNNTYLKR